LLALRRVAALGDPETIDATLACFQDEAADVRHGAVALLLELTHRGDSTLLLKLSSLLKGTSADTRFATLSSMMKLAHHGDASVVSLLVDCSTDAHWPVRRAAVHGLEEIAVKGDAVAVRTLIERFDDDKSQIRQAAIKAVARLSRPADSTVVLAVVRMLQDADRAVVRSAIFCLEELSVKNDLTISSLLELLDVDDSCTVSAALMVLGRLVDRGSSPSAVERIITYLSRLENASTSARKDAVIALGCIAPTGDAMVIQVLNSFVAEDRDAVVQKAAQLSLDEIGAPRHEVLREREDPFMVLRHAPSQPVC